MGWHYTTRCILNSPDLKPIWPTYRPYSKLYQTKKAISVNYRSAKPGLEDVDHDVYPPGLIEDHEDDQKTPAQERFLGLRQVTDQSDRSMVSGKVSFTTHRTDPLFVLLQWRFAKSPSAGDGSGSGGELDTT